MLVMLSTLPECNFSFSFTFILWSANAFNLDQSKILSFGKELTLYHTISKLFSTIRKELFEDIVAKREKIK